MKRRPLLIAACTFAAVSLGLNAWLLVLRKDRTSGSGSPQPVQDVPAAPSLQPVSMDFSDTAFADGSWKLTEGTEPAITTGTFQKLTGSHEAEMWAFGVDSVTPVMKDDKPVDLEKPFQWQNVPLTGPIEGKHAQQDPTPSASRGVVTSPQPVRSDNPDPARKEKSKAGSASWEDLRGAMRQGRRHLDIPSYLGLPEPDPTDVRSKALIAHPLPRR